ncbi:dihydroorotase [uncultured Leifsonia sp.]|uniref:dihydroorotase n=1 Tax=uncultured Leifsonia sp. TaxID=340359 RepID=UPI0028D19524|nr:dihydroorotase [uncultured Leifsonia sp.]
MDLEVVEGLVTAIRPAANPTDDGAVLLPGLVDLHTHLREPGGEAQETLITGGAAAAAGGFTDVFAMANTEPVTDSVERVEWLRAHAPGDGAARIHPVAAITVGLDGDALTAMEALASAGVTLFSDDGRCVDRADLMREALHRAHRTGTVIAQHAQLADLAGNGQINAGRAARATGLPPWPASAEAAIIARDAVLAAETGGSLHVCHVSTAASVDVIRWAKSRGWPVTAEVTPHHLILTDASADSADPVNKVNPPLRGQDDVRSLRRALVDGTIDAIATDHAPHTRQSKQRPWIDAPFGMTGLETALGVVVRALLEEDALDWQLLARVMSTRPAQIGRLGPASGRLPQTGAVADFVLVEERSPVRVDPSRHLSRSKNSPFGGLELPCRVLRTVVGGRVAFEA